MAEYKTAEKLPVPETLPAPKTLPATETLPAATQPARALKIIVPGVLLLLALAGWEWWVHAYQIPHYVIPAPSLIWSSLLKDWSSLSASWWFTVQLTGAA